MILLGADPLSRFINRAAVTPFAWGRFDCLLWLADWVIEQREVDPAGFLRGRYTTMLGAARIVRDGGGMVELVDRQTNLAGLRRVGTGRPLRGDIAVVSMPGIGGEHFGNAAGAILLGGTVVLLCQDGLVMPRLADVPVLMAWRV
jgi:hypothetical protein